MHTFQESGGRVWELKLDIAALERCAASGVRFEEILGGKSDLLMRLRFDAPLIARALAAICRPDFAARAIKTDEEFIGLLSAESLCAAKSALRDEVIDFFSAFDPAAGRVLQSWRETDRALADKLAAIPPPMPPPSSGAESGAAPASAE